MSDIFDSRDLLDELKTLKKEKELNKKLNIDVIDYEEEALRNLNGLIESIITGNDAYTFANFKADVEEAQREVEEL